MHPRPCERLTADDFETAARLARQGFGHSRETFEQYLALFGGEVLRGVRSDGGELAAVAAVWPMPQWFGGRPIPSSGVAMVAVDPAERGRRFGSDLMRGVLEDARQAGAALSVLHPATLPFYSRLGYGRGGVCCGWSAPLDILPTDAVDGDIVAYPGRDAGPLASLRRSLLVLENGLPERSVALWTLALTGTDGEPADLFLLRGQDGPEGYLALSPPKDRSIAVTDHCLPTRRSLLLAARLLAGFRAQADRVHWRGGPDDPMGLLASDCGLGLEVREEWLLRILDVRRALESRGYPPGVSGSVTLDVTDPLIAANTGQFLVDLDPDCVTVTQIWDDQADCLQIRISTLASLFSGYADARSLARSGLLSGPMELVETADRIFRVARPWMTDRF